MVAVRLRAGQLLRACMIYLRTRPETSLDDQLIQLIQLYVRCNRCYVL